MRFRWLRIVGDPDDLVVFVISGVVFEIQVHGFFAGWKMVNTTRNARFRGSFWALWERAGGSK